MPEKPLIAIQDLLQAVQQSRPPAPPNPLLQFKSIQTISQQHPTLPDGYRELYAVRELLNRLLLNVLGDDRSSHNNTEIRQALAQDFQTDNAFIEAYSLLYYRYMRPELGFSFQQISQITQTSTRTLHRRKQEGYQHLLVALIDYEAQAGNQDTIA